MSEREDEIERACVREIAKYLRVPLGEAYDEANDRAEDVFAIVLSRFLLLPRKSNCLVTNRKQP